MEIKILDTGIFINKEIVIADELYTTQNVLNEIKDEQTKLVLAEHYFNLQVKNPSSTSVAEIQNFIKNMNTNLSPVDIEVIALTYEIYNEHNGGWIDETTIDKLKTNVSVTCLTKDMGMQAVLNDLNITNYFMTKKYFKYRCFACFNIFEKQIDFCKICGHKTVTRVAFIKNNDKEIMCLKKDFKFKERQIKDKKGKDIVCEDIPEYKKYLRNVNYKTKQVKKQMDFF